MSELKKRFRKNEKISLTQINWEPYDECFNLIIKEFFSENPISENLTLLVRKILQQMYDGAIDPNVVWKILELTQKFNFFATKLNKY